MKKILFLVFISLSIISCNKEKTQKSFASKVEKAHNKKTYISKNATQFDILLFFDGIERLNAKLTLTNDSQQGKIELASGEEIIFSGNEVYISSGVNEEKARFDAYTWAYFFQFPFKLSDPGTNWEGFMMKTDFTTQKLTFDSGTGDAPEDWYIVYTHPETYLIDHAAYIVTAHASKEEAEKNPHAIKYSNYTTIDGVRIAQEWGFYNWSIVKDLEDKIGEASLNNIEFIEVTDDFFNLPSSYREVK